MHYFFVQCIKVLHKKLSMLKEIFSSNTRVKLLNVFLLNPEEEYFIRELTRLLDEQINSVRRELDNLKKVGLLKARSKNRKKYYHVNKDFIIYNELRNICAKASAFDTDIVKQIKKLGDFDLIVLSGVFVDEQETKNVDLLLVGQADKVDLEKFLKNELKFEREVKYSLMSKEDFLYRFNLNDKFIKEMVKSEKNIIPLNKIKELEL